MEVRVHVLASGEMALLYISFHRVTELTMLSEDYFILIIECREIQIKIPKMCPGWVTQSLGHIPRL